MAITDLGKAVPVFRGNFNLSTVYEKLDIVTSAGSSYVAKLDTTGNALSNGTYWALLAQAGDYAGTAIGVCGENLFHNWDFRNPVNQRAVTGTISTAGYFYDRWMLNSGFVQVAAGYLTIADEAVIEQRIEGNSLADTEVTVSVDIEGTIVAGSGSFPNVAGTAAVTLAGFGTATLGYATGYIYVRLTPNADRNVVRVKLELGTVSTLDRQPPMDYGVELAKCKRYFEVLAGVLGQGITGDRVSAPPFAVEKRIVPTVTARNMVGGLNSISLYNTAGTVYAASGVIIQTRSSLRYIIMTVPVSVGGWYQFSLLIFADL